MSNTTAVAPIKSTIQLNYTVNNLLGSIKYNNSKIFLNFYNSIFIYSIINNNISKIYNYSHSANNITHMDMKIIDNYVWYSISNSGIGYTQIPSTGSPLFSGMHVFSYNVYCFTKISGYIVAIGTNITLYDSVYNKIVTFPNLNNISYGCDIVNNDTIIIYNKN